MFIFLCVYMSFFKQAVNLAGLILKLSVSCDGQRQKSLSSHFSTI